MAITKRPLAGLKKTKEEIAADKLEYQRKFPHRNLEQCLDTWGAFMIVVGSDTTPLVKSQLFCGFKMCGMVMMPFFETPTRYNAPRPVVYFDREVAHLAVTELLAWYATEGIKHGVACPKDLYILA